MRHSHLLLLAVLFSAVSCHHSNDIDLSGIVGEKIAWPSSLVKVHKGIVSQADAAELVGDQSVLYYYDEYECSSCVVHKMSEWKECTEKEVGVTPIFLLSMPEDLSDVTVETKIDTALTVFLDVDNTFLSDNSFIPPQSLYHSFLIDKNGNIQLVGNPLAGERLLELYKSTISK